MNYFASLEKSLAEPGRIYGSLRGKFDENLQSIRELILEKI